MTIPRVTYFLTPTRAPHRVRKYTPHARLRRKDSADFTRDLPREPPPSHIVMSVFLVTSLAFQPAMRVQVNTPARVSAPVCMSDVSRRAALAGAAAAAFGALPAFAEGEVSYALKKDYREDAKQMLNNMRTATELTRGEPGMEDTVKKTRSEMNDFVAFYRRQPKVAGMPSFSTLYTAINTLSGHYASYGNKYPVPTKRKERLQQQYKEIDRALARGK